MVLLQQMNGKAPLKCQCAQYNTQTNVMNAWTFLPPGSEYVKITHNCFAPPSAQIFSKVSILKYWNCYRSDQRLVPMLTLGFFIARVTLHSPFSWKGRMMAAILSFHCWLESDKAPIIGIRLNQTIAMDLWTRKKEISHFPFLLLSNNDSRYPIISWLA